MAVKWVRINETWYCPALGAPELARRVQGLLDAAGLGCELDEARGLDHGAWVPLTLMYPGAEVPVAQLSLQTPGGPGHHLALGRALAPLRDEGILVLASGGATHNLHAYFAGGHGEDAPALAQVTDFEAWLVDAVAAGRTDDLLDYRARAPHGAWNHPSDEHLLPLFVAIGAGAGAGGEAKGRCLHRSHARAVLSMAAFAFG